MDDVGDQLRDAAINGNVHKVRELIAKGANVNDPDEEFGDRPLHRAAMEGRTEAARILLEHHADVNAADNLGSRPLHWAAEGGYMDLVGLLLEKGAQREGQTEVAAILKRIESLPKRSSQRGR
jgi:ankyrin repeat protein